MKQGRFHMDVEESDGKKLYVLYCEDRTCRAIVAKSKNATNIVALKKILICALVEFDEAGLLSEK